MSHITTQRAKGFAYSHDSATVKIAVSMPREDFNCLREKAIRLGWSISEVIRQYVNTGIIVDKEMGEWPEPEEIKQTCIVDISRCPGLREALGATAFTNGE